MRKHFIVFAAIALLGQAANGAAASATCDRSCLEGLVNQYLDAMLARNPFSLPLAPKVKFTENEQVLKLGEGLWLTASAPGTYKLYAADPQAGEVGFLGTMRENGTPIALSIRLKVDNRRIAEAETLIIREPDSAKLIEAMGKPDPSFLETVPDAQRKSRDELIAIANKYYDGIEQSKGGIVAFDPACNRVQNGLQTTNNREYKMPPPMTWNPLALGCKEQLDTGFFSFIRKVYPRRFLVVDEERGLVFGSFLFQIPGTVKSINVPGQGTIPMAPTNLSPYTLDVVELFKIGSGRIKKVEALQARLPYGTPSPFFGDK
jgi:hypothetical protein